MKTTDIHPKNVDLCGDDYHTAQQCLYSEKCGSTVRKAQEVNATMSSNVV